MGDLSIRSVDRDAADIVVRVVGIRGNFVLTLAQIELSIGIFIWYVWCPIGMNCNHREPVIIPQN